jgi:exodeoxyribonuclease V alpha subunit
MTEIRQLLSSGAFSDLDRHFAEFIEAQAGDDQPLVGLAAALVSQRQGQGDICLDLRTVAGRQFPEMPADGVEPIRLPRLTEWTKAIRRSSVVGAPGLFKPLVLDTSNRLYLHRYWAYEQSLAEAIRKRAADLPPPPDPEKLSQAYQALFPHESEAGEDGQGRAALAAVRKRFCVITGGPGTGKTHTLVLILALLLELERSRKLRIAVAAPTGKAAARIQDSIRTAKATLALGEAIQAQLPEHATTIHRLLGYMPDAACFRYNADNLLPVDVVAVDEASMVDLALMAKLFQAIPASARVILLGDKDQLASVEAGAVLGDICSAAASANGLSDCVVQLRKNYRFSQHSAINRLGIALYEARVEEALQILKDADANKTADLASAPLPSRAELKEALRTRVIAGFSQSLQAPDPLAALAALARFRILCAVREGPFGVSGLNQATEAILAEAGMIDPQSPWYAGRPIMITRNEYSLKLFNGDIGILLPDGESDELRAFFPGPDNTLRKFLPLRLPQHETAFAMTVHKSQGSEFDRVLLILPDRESPVLSRELLYTGITRARAGVELWFEPNVFQAALASRGTRTSGLRDALQ